MTSFQDRLRRHDALLRSHLDPDEHVLAVGRCADITRRGSVQNGGAGATYVMITDKKLRWVPDADPRFEAALDFADVTGVRERASRHRYAMALEHAPLTRSYWTSAHRFLTFEWGNRVVASPPTRTVLAFSRRDTKAAIALRDRVSKALQEHP